MLFYFFVFAVIAILALLSHGKSSRDQKILSIISAIIIVCFQGFRWRTGTDWEPYLNAFLRPEANREDYEIGHYIFNKAIRLFTGSYTVFLFIQCSIVAICQLKVADYFKVKNGSLVMLMSFVTTPFPIRYTMAVSIFLLSYKYIVENKLIKFIICTLIAASIHQIVIVALPFYFITRRIYSTKILFVVYLSCCMVGLMTELVFTSFRDGMNMVIQLLPEFSQYKLNYYMDEMEAERTLSSIIISYVNGAVFIYLFTKLRYLRYKDDAKYNVLLNLYVFGLAFGRVAITALPYLSRAIACFSGGFILMSILGINALHMKSKNNTTIIQSFTLFGFIIYMFMIYHRQLVYYYPVFVPYFSIFSSSTRTVIF